MFTVEINGKEYASEKDWALLDFLREELHILSAKDGCHEGACGTCTVIIDNRAVRACVQKLSKLAGKKIQTIEGFTEREREVFAYAFSEAGSVQCGFCIPGMVVCGKCLIDNNPDPTREEVKNAIKNNICRCTGYQKIEDGILLAARMLRENIPVPGEKEKAGVGRKIHRVDARDKTLGEAKYAADYFVEGMLYGKNLFTKHPRAKILAIDTSKAKEAEGVVAVFTAEDIPGSRYIGHLAKDWPGMIAVGETTKCIGDTLAMVVAKTPEQAVRARELVEVSYEVLEPVTSPEESRREGAPLIHGEGFMQFGKFQQPTSNLFSRQVVNRGNAREAIAGSKYVAHGIFTVPFTEHAFMEPETAVGIPDGEDGIFVITGAQGIYDEKHELSEYLGIPMEKVRIRSAVVGGGFGGKEDMSVQHQAALCAFLLKQPVKVTFSRQESINYHPKRHAMTLDVTVGCDENGIIQGTKAYIVSDTGAYASLGGPVLQRACTHAGGPYNYQNFDIQGEAYYTNNPPAGAFRGFGVTQSVAVTECLINDLARQVGIDGWEIRYRNAIVPGKVLPNGQIADEGTAYLETLLALKEDFYRYERDPNYYVGIASAMKNAGIGVGIKDPGRCNLYVHDEKVHVRSSAAPIGQGLQTVIYQMVSEVLGMDSKDIILEAPDTSYAPNAGTTTASRQTVYTGQAAREAALLLKADLDAGRTLLELEGKLYEGEFDYDTDPITSDKEFPVSHIAYGYATHLYVIDREGKLVKVIAAHDSGTIINPLSCEGQVEGGVAMGIGYGLTEDFPLENSVPKAKLGTLGLVKALQMPPVETRFVTRNTPDKAGFGAKGIGEIVCTLGAPALQNAYFKKDGIFRTEYPLKDTYYRKAKK